MTSSIPLLSVPKGENLESPASLLCCFVHSILLSCTWLFIQLLISGRDLTAGDAENYKAPQDQPFETAKKHRHYCLSLKSNHKVSLTTTT